MKYFTSKWNAKFSSHFLLAFWSQKFHFQVLATKEAITTHEFSNKQNWWFFSSSHSFEDVTKTTQVFQVFSTQTKSNDSNGFNFYCKIAPSRSNKWFFLQDPGTVKCFINFDLEEGLLRITRSTQEGDTKQKKNNEQQCIWSIPERRIKCFNDFKNQFDEKKLMRIAM